MNDFKSITDKVQENESKVMKKATYLRIYTLNCKRVAPLVIYRCCIILYIRF